MQRYIPVTEQEAEEQKKGGNIGLPFGLCEKYGISLPQGATPRDAWDALEREKGIKPEDIYNKKPQNLTPKALSLEQYLGERGLSAPMSDYMFDKLKIPHGETQRQKNKREKEAINQLQSYHAKREAAVNEYNQAVQRGEIREPSTIERALIVAKGHEDNEAVRAARRILEKRGIDWRTGKKLI